MAYTLRKYREEDKERVLSLLESVLGKDIAGRITRRWDWEYHGNPNNTPEGPQILVLERDNKIVGFLSGFFVSLKIKDKIFKAVWGVDQVTHLEHRGRGAFLTRKYLRGPYVYLATSNPASYPINKRIGAFDACKPINFLKIIDFKDIIQSKIHSSIASSFIALICKTIFFPVSLFNFSNMDTELVITEIERFDEEIDKFWQEICVDYPIIVVRDRKYLNWRFADYPGKKYSIYLAKKNNKVCGYIVFCSREDRGLKHGYIVDVLVRKDDKKTLGILIQQAVQVLTKERVDLVSCLISSPDNLYYKALKSNGFIFKTRHTPAMAYCNSAPALKQSLGDSKLWFMTRGDSDIGMF